MWKLMFISTLFSMVSVSAQAGDTYVRGYMRRDGQYVAPYHRTTQDNSINNNYGTQGNLNPYTGRSGAVERQTNDGFGDYNLGNGWGTYPQHRRTYQKLWR